MSPARVKLFGRSKSPLRIFIFIILLGISFSFVKFFYTSWSQRIWNTQSRLTVVVASENPIVYSLDPQTENLVKFAIPKNTQINASYGYGDWLVGSLWGLGEQEKIGGGLLRESMQKSFGIPVDAWVDQNGERLFLSYPLGWVSAIWEVITSSNLKTNLTFFDRAKLIFHLSQVKTSDRRALDLENTGIIIQKKLSDGDLGYLVLTERAKVTLDILRDNKVFSEAKKVIIVNSTGKSGIAGEVAQISSILGARVIGVQTGDEVEGNCVLLGNQISLKSLTAQRLKIIFGCEEIQENLTEIADLEIMLKKGYLKNY